MNKLHFTVSEQCFKEVLELLLLLNREIPEQTFNCGIDPKSLTIKTRAGYRIISAGSVHSVAFKISYKECQNVLDAYIEDTVFKTTLCSINFEDGILNLPFSKHPITIINSHY
jgi:hypothetical protein